MILARLCRPAAMALMLGVALAPAARAQQSTPVQTVPSGPLSLLVVDVQQVMKETKAAKGIAQQIEQQRQVYTKEISASEANLKTQRDELERQRSLLSPEQFNQKGREFQQKVDELARNSQAKKETLEYSHHLAMKKVLDNMLAVVSDIAIERKATVVLPKDAVLLVDKNLDVTAETMQRLDQRLPSVPVSMVSPRQQGAASPASSSSGKGKGGSQKKN